MRWKGWLFCEPEPEHCVSEETWNGGDGKIDFNYVQQSPVDVDDGEVPNLDMDPWGIVYDVYRGPGGS